MKPRLLLPSLLGASLAMLAGCEEEPPSSYSLATGGDVERGRLTIERHGCGSCHTIPGIDGADALVGPSLEHVASRTYLAGVMTNSPSNLIRWIEDPPAVDEKTAMPDLHLTDEEVRNVASYLGTLK